MRHRRELDALGGVVAVCREFGFENVMRYLSAAWRAWQAEQGRPVDAVLTLGPSRRSLDMRGLEDVEELLEAYDAATMFALRGWTALEIVSAREGAPAVWRVRTPKGYDHEFGRDYSKIGAIRLARQAANQGSPND